MSCLRSVHLTDAVAASQRLAPLVRPCGARSPASQLGSTEDSSCIVDNRLVQKGSRRPLSISASVPACGGPVWKVNISAGHGSVSITRLSSRIVNVVRLLGPFTHRSLESLTCDLLVDRRSNLIAKMSWLDHIGKPVLCHGICADVTLSRNEGPSSDQPVWRDVPERNRPAARLPSAG